jgi:hypothetical protein
VSKLAEGEAMIWPESVNLNPTVSSLSYDRFRGIQQDLYVKLFLFMVACSVFIHYEY